MPTWVIVVAVGLACFLIGSGGVWLLIFKPSLDERDRKHKALLKVYAEALDARDKAHSTAQVHHVRARFWIKQHKLAVDDRVEAQNRCAMAELELDMLRDRYLLLPTLDGIRAEAADGRPLASAGGRVS